MKKFGLNLANHGFPTINNYYASATAVTRRSISGIVSWFEKKTKS